LSGAGGHAAADRAPLQGGAGCPPQRRQPAGGNRGPPGRGHARVADGEGAHRHLGGGRQVGGTAGAGVPRHRNYTHKTYHTNNTTQNRIITFKKKMFE